MNSSLFIVGFMASGKSTLAKNLAQYLHLPMLDTDEEIVKEEGESVAEIFRKKGEHYFRSLEKELISKLTSDVKIVSCGGGLPCFHDNILMLKNLGTVLYLSSSMETILSRLSMDSERPLVQAPEGLDTEAYLSDLYENRRIYYHLSDIEMDNNLSLNQMITVLKENNILQK